MTDIDIIAPRFEQRAGFVVAGLAGRFRPGEISGIPRLWQDLNERAGALRDVVDGAAYGVCYNPGDDDSFDYAAGLEVSDDISMPEGFVSVHLPAARYAVFRHDGHISTFPDTVMAIWNEKLAALKLKVVNQPNFERYGPEFDAETGLGGVELWIPISG